MKFIFWITLIAGVSTKGWALPYRKLLVEPVKLGVLTSGSCERVSLKLVNAEGKGVVLEREKAVALSSSSVTTTFFSDFDPPCTEAVKTSSVSFEPGKNEVSFYFRDDLLQTSDLSQKGIPHGLTITIASKGIEPVSISGEVKSNDCSVACRDTCIRNRESCTKACPEPKDHKASAREKRKCWSDCFVGEEMCFLGCQKSDLRYPTGECGAVCRTYCEYDYGDCFGKCYFHKNANQTSFGVKCGEECFLKREQCRREGCLSSEAP